MIAQPASGLTRRAFDAWLDLWWEWSPTVLRLALTAVVVVNYWSATGPHVLAAIVLLVVVWVAGR
jgi:hypothetical protein